MARKKEIGSAATSVRRRPNRAVKAISPLAAALFTNEIGTEAKAKSRRKRPITRMNSRVPLAASADTGDQSDTGDNIAQIAGVPAGKGIVYDASALATILRQIADNQKIRRHCIKTQSRLDRSLESLIASYLGYKPQLPEAERKEIFRQAAAFRKSVEKGGEAQSCRETHTTIGLSALIPLVQANMQSRKVWDDHRDNAESEMKALAKRLPVWPWVDTISGFGPLGLAIIVAEAGQSHDLGTFATKQRLWKMLELAVIDGERQQRKTGKEDAARHGYGGKRRSEMWAQFSDSMFRHQWRGEASAYREAIIAHDKARRYCERSGIDLTKIKEVEQLREIAEPFGITAKAYPRGLYGEIYERRKAHTEPRIMATHNLHPKDPAKWNAKRCESDARRIMTKELIADLWQQWRNVTPLTVECEVAKAA